MKNASHNHLGSPLRRRARQAIRTLAVTGVFAMAGVLFLRFSAAAPAANPHKSPAIATQNAAQSNSESAGARLLRPVSLGYAPYAYVPYGNIAMADFMADTGTKNFFGAFILGTGCVPLWDGNATLGLDSSRSAEIRDDIKAVRAKGGEVAVSFGGQSGSELSDSCTDPNKLQEAYQNVITEYALKHINFDIESASETSQVGLQRRVQATAALQKANPGLRVSLTIPVEESGLSSSSLGVVKKFYDSGVALTNINIMAMDFQSTTGAQSGKVIKAAQGTISQLAKLYTTESLAQLWKGLGIIVMVGQNDTKEVFQLADAHIVHDFAVKNGVGTMGSWSANRDQACPGGNNPVANIACSGQSQTKYQFSRILSIPGVQ